MSDKQQNKSKEQEQHPTHALFVGIGFDRTGRERIGKPYSMFDVHTGTLYYSKSGKLLPAVSDDNTRMLTHSEMLKRPDYSHHKPVTMSVGSPIPLPAWDDARMAIVYASGKFARADSVYPSKVREFIAAGKSPAEIYEWLIDHKAVLGQEAYEARLAEIRAKEEVERAKLEAQLAEEERRAAIERAAESGDGAEEEDEELTEEEEQRLFELDYPEYSKAELAKSKNKASAVPTATTPATNEEKKGG